MKLVLKILIIYIFITLFYSCKSDIDNLEKDIKQRFEIEIGKEYIIQCKNNYGYFYYNEEGIPDIKKIESNYIHSNSNWRFYIIRFQNIIFNSEFSNCLISYNYITNEIIYIFQSAIFDQEDLLYIFKNIKCSTIEDKKEFSNEIIRLFMNLYNSNYYLTLVDNNQIIYKNNHDTLKFNFKNNYLNQISGLEKYYINNYIIEDRINRYTIEELYKHNSKVEYYISIEVKDSIKREYLTCVNIDSCKKQLFKKYNLPIKKWSHFIDSTKYNTIIYSKQLN